MRCFTFLFVAALGVTSQAIFLTGYFCPSCPSNPDPRNLVSKIHPAYNVIHFAFLGFDDSGTILNELDSPYPSSSKVFNVTKDDVKFLQSQNRKVFVSVGGGDGAVLDCASSSAFVTTLTNGLLESVDMYGWDGVDFDIEHRSGDYVACGKIISSVIAGLKRGKASLLISLAPQMTNLYPEYPSIVSGFNELAPVVSDSLTHIDFIQPQMYNTWAGVETVAYAKTYTGALEAGFTASGEGSSFPVQLPRSKIVLGYPSSPRGAGTGYLPPSEVFPLVSQLGIKGIMGWSIGWDALNGWAFADAAEAADDMGLNLTHIL